MSLVVVREFKNDDNDNVQTSANIFFGIANRHSGSIITPYLGRNPLKGLDVRLANCELWQIFHQLKCINYSLL